MMKKSRRGEATDELPGAAVATVQAPGSPGPWPAPAGPHIANLSFVPGSAEAALLAAAAMQQMRSNRRLTKYEREGMDPHFAQQRYNSASETCRCGREGRCHLKLKLTVLQELSRAYWTMDADERAHALRSIYQVSANFPASSWHEDAVHGGEKASRLCARWHLSGVRVCLANFTHLLGTTERTLWKQIQGIPDGRAARAIGGVAKQSQAVDFFFYELYMSAAEPLPTDPRDRRRPGLSAGALVSEFWVSCAACLPDLICFFVACARSMRTSTTTLGLGYVWVIH